jgi:hypothetical protein
MGGDIVPDAFEANPSDLIPGVWQHFKGPVYQVLGVARHHETGKAFVVYWSDAHNYWCVREKEDFLSKVERPEANYHGPRFWRQGNWYQSFVKKMIDLFRGIA